LASVNVDSPTISFTTDFGLSDNYAGIIKGIIARINPLVKIIDLNHNLPPFDIDSAKYQLQTAYRSFPDGAIHLAVVDPGVGTKRNPIAIETDEYFFVGPDNGLFSFLDKGSIRNIVRLDNEEYFSMAISTTFHGRDIFAPAAGWLSLGIAVTELGKTLRFIKKTAVKSNRVNKSGVFGRIIYIDGFGNCVTSIAENEVGGRKARVIVSETPCGLVKKSFGDVRQGKPVAYINSFGYFEIGVNLGSAAEKYGIMVGDKVQILFA